MDMWEVAWCIYLRNHKDDWTMSYLHRVDLGYFWCVRPTRSCRPSGLSLCRNLYHWTTGNSVYASGFGVEGVGYGAGTMTGNFMDEGWVVSFSRSDRKVSNMGQMMGRRYGIPVWKFSCIMFLLSWRLWNSCRQRGSRMDRSVPITCMPGWYKLLRELEQNMNQNLGNILAAAHIITGLRCTF